jgi:hypothetical protein
MNWHHQSAERCSGLLRTIEMSFFKLLTEIIKNLINQNEQRRSNQEG